MIRPAIALALIAALALALAGCPSSASCAKGPTLTGAEAEAEAADVLRAVEAWRQASEARGMNALFALYDHGKSVTLVTQGAAIVGWDAVSSELTARFTAAKEIHYKLTDIHVAGIGGGAVATAALSREISDGVKSVSDTGTLTLALGKTADGWVIVAEHFSFRPM